MKKKRSREYIYGVTVALREVKRSKESLKNAYKGEKNGKVSDKIYMAYLKARLLEASWLEQEIDKLIA